MVSMDSSFVLTGRHMRSVWRDQEESFAKESAHYAKRRLTLLEYLANVSHAGHDVAVRTAAFEVHGTLVHIGNDFFSVASSENPRIIHSFRLHHDDDQCTSPAIEIDISEKSQRACTIPLLRQDKTFRSLLDDVFNHNKNIEIESIQGNIYSGRFELLADAILRSKSEKEDETLVNAGSTIVPIEAIVSVLYSI